MLKDGKVWQLHPSLCNSPDEISTKQSYHFKLILRQDYLISVHGLPALEQATAYLLIVAIRWAHSSSLLLTTLFLAGKQRLPGDKDTISHAREDVVWENLTDPPPIPCIACSVARCAVYYGYMYIYSCKLTNIQCSKDIQWLLSTLLGGSLQWFLCHQCPATTQRAIEYPLLVLGIINHKITIIIIPCSDTCTCIYMCNIVPYSRKLLREKTFTN